MDAGELGTLSLSDRPRGVRCSSEFSDIVSPISIWLPKLEYASSDCLRNGLRRREGAERGLGDLGGLTTADMRTCSAVSAVGEECARAIAGADREFIEDLDCKWFLANGEVVRGRDGNIDICFAEVCVSGLGKWMVRSIS